MAKICRNCGRRMETPLDPKTGKRKRSSEHVCSTVTIQRKKKDTQGKQMTKIVNEDRVSKGGDLYKLVTGRNAPWEVVFRTRQKIESAIEKRKAKKDEKTLVAPSGEPLTPPKG